MGVGRARTDIPEAVGAKLQPLQTPGRRSGARSRARIDEATLRNPGARAGKTPRCLRIACGAGRSRLSYQRRPMKKCVRSRVQSISLVLILLAPPHAAAPGGTPFPAPGPLYAREPDVGAAAILFVSGDDLWTVPRAGGVARRVAAGAGKKRRPKLSPDGATIAFTGPHDALYTVPSAGGEPRRVTHHPGATDLCDWTPDGRLLFMPDAFSHLFNAGGQASIRQLFTVAAGGGLPERIPLPYGANGALDDGGEWLAYTYYAEGRSEARGHHLGGNAPDVWLFNPSTRASRKITEWEGIDTAPMWHERTVY